MKSVIAILSLLATVAVAAPVGGDPLGSTLSGVGAGSAPELGQLESALGEQPTTSNPQSESTGAEGASPSGEAQPQAAQPQDQNNSSKDILSSLLGGVLKE